MSDVSTPAATLEASGQNVGIYTDLETGNSYASVVIQQTDVGTVVDMPLTLQAVADFNSVSDFFSVGLSVDSLTRFTGNEGVRFSGSSEPRIHLLAVDHDAGGGLTVTVNNVDPVANADADQTVDEGDLVTLNGSFTDQGTDDGHKEEWTVVASNGESIAPLTINNLTGDSNGSGGSSFSFTPGDNGTYTVTYTVTDDDGGVHSDISVISVNNVDPEILSLSATSVNEDGTVTLTGTYDDAGSLDTHTIDIDWGLGETASLGVVVSGGGFSVTHQYLDDNPTITPSDVYAIGVTLDDDDGGSDSDSTTTTITNVDPVIDSFTVDSAVINEDGSVTVSGSISDVGTQDTHTVEIDWGGSEGTSAATVIQGAGSATFTATHQYLDDDPSISSSDTYTITATVTDDDSGQDTDALDITVNNVAPAITDITSGAEKCGTAHEDDPITLDLSFDDIGSLDVHTVEIDWGDNETDTIVLTAGDRTLSVDHDYDTGGIYTIIVTVTDDDSGLDQTSLLAVVSGVGLNGGVLQIIGTAGDDHVTLNQTGNGLLKVHADFIPEDALGETRDFPLADVNRIFMLLCDGNDHATISGRITLDAIIDGGAGDDHLNGGDGSNVILGREGNDHINGGSGRDILIGGLGEDRIVGNPESDLISGGVLQNSSTTATDSIGDEDNLLTMQARLQDATDTEIDDWVAGTDDFFAGLELELVDDGGVADQLTGSSADDLFFAFANDDVTDASSNGNGNGGTNKGKGKK
ncbi:MAG: hypothetical protein H8E66_04335 [Planctomycetes bacterium]|nr:hypothetical protein [Planctomycetota bacterium]